MNKKYVFKYRNKYLWKKIEVIGANAAYLAGNNAFFNTNLTDTKTTGISVNTSANLDHSHNVDLPNFTGNSGNGPGTTTAFSTEPNYINVVYLIRVN